MFDTESFSAMLGPETKSIPVICSWCRKVFDIKRWTVSYGERITPDYGICPDCHRKVRIESSCGQLEMSEKSGRILIVDDEGGFCGLLFDMLHPHGYRIITCNSGEDALEYYAGRHSEVDLVLLDMKMPEIDGYETFLSMKRINPSVKAIIVTGYSRDGEIRDILAAGALCVLEKPFSPDTLVERIRAVLQKD